MYHRNQSHWRVGESSDNLVGKTNKFFHDLDRTTLLKKQAQTFNTDTSLLIMILSFIIVSPVDA